LQIRTRGQGLVEITEQIADAVLESGCRAGICAVFVCHTSASLVIQENADPSVRRDLESFLSRLVPEGDPQYTHTLEGSDDMPAHIRSALTHTSETIPIHDGVLALGTWQGIYLWEHRHRGSTRRIQVQIVGQ
jgi:secondary thiamine-phosphate synthase enzyme